MAKEFCSAYVQTDKVEKQSLMLKNKDVMPVNNNTDMIKKTKTYIMNVHYIEFQVFKLIIMKYFTIRTI